MCAGKVELNVTGDLRQKDSSKGKFTRYRYTYVSDRVQQCYSFWEEVVFQFVFVFEGVSVWRGSKITCNNDINSHVV